VRAITSRGVREEQLGVEVGGGDTAFGEMPPSPGETVA
jgi:hypothetical protein